MQEQELQERLALIETMMQQGRKTTEYWGWSFLLWGIAYLVAIAWGSLGPQGTGRDLSWPVTMIAAALLTAVIARRRTRSVPRTERSRAIQATWTAVGCGLFVFALPVAFSGHWEVHSSMAAIEAMLGGAHMASGLMLRWRAQMLVGGLWWAAAVASCFIPPNGVGILFLGATLVGQVGFGIYLMVRESRDKARARAARVQHA
jgi:hypothetical protein